MATKWQISFCVLNIRISFYSTTTGYSFFENKVFLALDFRSFPGQT